MPDGIDAFNQSPGVGVQCADCGAHFDLDPAGEIANAACSECGGKRFFRDQPSPVHDDLSGINQMKDMPGAARSDSPMDTGGSPLTEGLAHPMSKNWFLVETNLEAPGLDTGDVDQYGIPIRREPGTMAPDSNANPNLEEGIAGFPLSEGTIVGENGEPSPFADTHGYDGYTHSHVPPLLVQGAIPGFQGSPELQQLAGEYNQTNGLAPHPQDYIPVDPQKAAQIAQAYQQVPHNPGDPQVKASYDALINETKNQYNHLVNNGYNFEFYPQGHDPYPNSPREAVADLHQNKHLYVYPTSAGYGMDENPTDHPMLQHTEHSWNGQPVTANDLFRAVHDTYGHAKEGVGFRADGEDNAYRQHAAMFSPLAQQALASETRGQNSWVNFGPHAATNQTAKQGETIYAPQKAGLMPQWAVDPNLHGQGQMFSSIKESLETPWGQDYSEWADTRPDYLGGEEGHRLGYDPNIHKEGKGFILNNGDIWTWPTQDMKPRHMDYAKPAHALGGVVPGSAFHIAPYGKIWQYGEGRSLDKQQQHAIRNADPRLDPWSMTNKNETPAVETNGYGHAEGLINRLTNVEHWAAYPNSRPFPEEMYPDDQMSGHFMGPNGEVSVPKPGSDGGNSPSQIDYTDVTHLPPIPDQPWIPADISNNFGPIHQGNARNQTFNNMTSMNTHGRETLSMDPYPSLWSDEHVSGLLGDVVQGLGDLAPVDQEIPGLDIASDIAKAAPTVMKGVGFAQNMFGGGQQGGMYPNPPITAPTMQQLGSTDIPMLILADLETSDSVKSVDEQHDDPQEQDQKEFDDGDKSPSNLENPNNEDSGASGEDGVRDATPGYGFGPNSPAIQHMQSILPLLLHYITNGLDGKDDPILQDLHQKLDSEQPGYLDKEHPDGPKLMEIIIQKHGPKKASSFGHYSSFSIPDSCFSGWSGYDSWYRHSVTAWCPATLSKLWRYC